MISVILDPVQPRLEMRGHACHGAPGQDIVCAAASIMAAALAARCRETALPGEIRQCILSPGRAVIEICPLPERHAAFREAFETIRAGLALLEKHYPENLRLETPPTTPANERRFLQ